MSAEGDFKEIQTESEVPRLNEVQLRTKVNILNGKGTIPTKAVIQIDEEFQIPK